MVTLHLAGWEREFVERQRVARLATVDTLGRPHVVPIVYVFDGQRLFTPFDAKPKRVGPHRLQRARNIQANPEVMVLVDEYGEAWDKLAWVQMRGIARLVESGPTYTAGISLLEAKYTQFATLPLAGYPLIGITTSGMTRWRA